MNKNEKQTFNITDFTLCEILPSAMDDNGELKVIYDGEVFDSVEQKEKYTKRVRKFIFDDIKRLAENGELKAGWNNYSESYSASIPLYTLYGETVTASKYFFIETPYNYTETEKEIVSFPSPVFVYILTEKQFVKNMKAEGVYLYWEDLV